jgi:hypothetical protein
MRLIKHVGADRVLDHIQQQLPVGARVDVATDGFSLFAFDELATHCIPVAAIRADDLQTFIQHRAAPLLGLIHAATGKTFAGQDSEETIEAFGASLAAHAERLGGAVGHRGHQLECRCK